MTTDIDKLIETEIAEYTTAPFREEISRIEKQIREVCGSNSSNLYVLREVSFYITRSTDGLEVSENITKLQREALALGPHSVSSDIKWRFPRYALEFSNEEIEVIFAYMKRGSSARIRMFCADVIWLNRKFNVKPREVAYAYQKGLEAALSIDDMNIAQVRWLQRFFELIKKSGGDKMDARIIIDKCIDHLDIDHPQILPDLFFQLRDVFRHYPDTRLVMARKIKECLDNERIVFEGKQLFMRALIKLQGTSGHEIRDKKDNNNLFEMYESEINRLKALMPVKTYRAEISRLMHDALKIENVKGKELTKKYFTLCVENDNREKVFTTKPIATERIAISTVALHNFSIWIREQAEQKSVSPIHFLITIGGLWWLRDLHRPVIKPQDFPFLSMIARHSVLSDGRHLEKSDPQDYMGMNPVEFDTFLRFSHISKVGLDLLLDVMRRENEWSLKILTSIFENSSWYNNTHKKIIRSALESHFSENYCSSIHVLIPHFERVFRFFLFRLGEPTTTYQNRKKSLEGRMLGDLIADQEIKKLLETHCPAFLQSFTVMISNSRGLGARHSVCHGFFPAADFSNEDDGVSDLDLRRDSVFYIYLHLELALLVQLPR